MQAVRDADLAAPRRGPWDAPARLDDLAALERTIPSTFELLDPAQPDLAKPTGGEIFEGFYFEARDSEGRPFLANAR